MADASCATNYYEFKLVDDGTLDIEGSGYFALSETEIYYDALIASNSDIKLYCSNGGCTNFELFNTAASLLNQINQTMYVECNGNETTCENVEFQCPSLYEDTVGTSSCIFNFTQLQTLVSQQAIEPEQYLYAYSGTPYVQVLCDDSSPFSCPTTEV